jgi:hypothetical protein
MYNIRLLPHFVFFVTFIYGVLTGIFIIRQNEFRMPFTRHTYIQGRSATFVGILLILLGLWSGWMLYRFLF